MKVLYHLPHPSTVSAGRTIAHGYRHAWLDKKHHFSFLTNDDALKLKLIDEQPDIFITALNSWHIRSLDLKALQAAKANGTKVFVNVAFWNSPISPARINENASLKHDHSAIELIKSGKYGDVYFNICEAGDPRMAGFQEATGYTPQTLLLAADATLLFEEQSEKFAADLSYIGTNLPDKRAFFKQVIFPLRAKYSVKIYGQDWTTLDRLGNFVQKVGQYFNIPYLKSSHKPQLQLSDERKIYASSLISINVHEHYQKQYGDLNERTFKIPLAGGFEIIDEVSSLSKYFTDGKDIVIAKNNQDWREKIEYYISHPEKRIPIINAGRKNVLAHHTYHHRVETMLEWYDELGKNK